MRVGPLGLPELFLLLFFYGLPIALIAWFVVSAVNFRREVRRRLEALERRLERSEKP